MTRYPICWLFLCSFSLLSADTAVAFQSFPSTTKKPTTIRSTNNHPWNLLPPSLILSNTIPSSSRPTNNPSSIIVVSSTSSDEDRTADDEMGGIISVLRPIFHGIGKTTSIFVSGTFFFALAYQRDALMVSFFIGSIGNAITGKILKRILNQERPVELETTDMKLKPGDKGMPSSHAMSLGFIGTFTGLTIPWTQLPILIYSFISLAYRIDIKLHTWQQIVVGFVVGSTNGAIWRYLCDGRNPFGINVMDFVGRTVLNEEGLLPMTMLAVPAIVGAVIVGSVERRLAGWLQKIKKE